MSLGLFLDIIPVTLAVYALFKLSYIKNNDTDILLSRIAACLLILCQLTWIQSYLNQFDIIQSFIDKLWAIFNTVVMILVIVIANGADDEGTQ